MRCDSSWTRRRRPVLMMASASTAVLIAGFAVPAAAQIVGAVNESQVINGAVAPDFKGGTLVADLPFKTDNNNYTLENFPTNTFDMHGTSTVLNGVLSGPGGITFVNSSAPTGSRVMLRGVNTYTGVTTIQVFSSDLELDGAGSIAASSSVIDNGGLDVSQATSPSIQDLAGAGQVWMGAGGLTITNAKSTFAGAIEELGAGGSSLTIAGGTEILTGVNSYTGATIITPNATLALSGAGSIATSSRVIVNGVLDLSAATSPPSISDLAGASTGQVWLGAQGLTLTNAGSTFAGVISGAGPLTITGGTETLSGVNTYTGPTTIAGILALSGSGSIATSSNVVANGSFDISQTTAGASITGLSGSNTGVVVLGAQTLTITGASAVNDVFVGVISDGGIGTGGKLTIAGGTETLAGDNTYRGVTTIAPAGTLALAAEGSIANSSDVVANGTFDISQTSTGASITGLSGSGAVALGAEPLTITGASAATDVFAGVISDGGIGGGTGGALVIAGGTETLTGANTYSGGTTIDGGATLQLGNGGGGGTVLGNITDYGSLVFDYGVNAVVANTITGPGSVTIAPAVAPPAGGYQAVYFTANNAYTGGTTIGAGSGLILGNGGTSGWIVGNVVLNGGGLDFRRSDNVTFDGTISGSGWIGVDGGGAVTLTADNSFTGETGIALGSTLQLGNGGTTGSVAASTIDVYDKSALVFDHSNTITYAGVIQQTGSVTVAGTGSVILTGANTYTGGTTIAPGATLQLGNGGTSGSVIGDIVDNGRLAFNRSDTATFAGNISGAGGLMQMGPGVTILNGNNTLTGAAQVLAGTLEVGDAAHPGAVLDSHVGGVQVGGAGTLAGHGTIAGAVTNTSGGAVAPGGSIGTLTVGSYAQGSNSTLAIEVSPAAASRLTSLGAASLNGKLALTFDPGAYGFHTYEIVAGAPVSGTFSSVTATGTPVVYSLYYKPDQVDLVVSNTASARVYGDVATATLDRAESFASLVEDRFGDAGCANGSGRKAEDEACRGLGAWAQAIGSSNHVAGNAGAYGFDDRGAGFVGGLDHRWSGAVIGAAFGYEDGELSVPGASAHATGKAYFASLYGRWTAGRFLLDGQGFYMNSDWSLSRSIPGSGTAASSPGGTTGGLLVQVSRPISGSDLRPYLRFTYAQFDRDAVTEGGVGSLGYVLQSERASSEIGEAGVIWGHTYGSPQGRQMTPAIRLGLQDDFSGRVRTLSGGMSGMPGAAFSLDYVTPRQPTGVVDASLKAQMSARFDLTADLRGRFNSDVAEGVATVGAAYRF